MTHSRILVPNNEHKYYMHKYCVDTRYTLDQIIKHFNKNIITKINWAIHWVGYFGLTKENVFSKNPQKMENLKEKR